MKDTVTVEGVRADTKAHALGWLDCPFAGVDPVSGFGLAYEVRDTCVFMLLLP
mgnify:CR=1 FL=1